MSKDIAIYVYDRSLEQLRDWAQCYLGPLHLVYQDTTHGTAVYHADQENAVSVTFQAGIDGRLFTEMSCRSETANLPWITDVECARQAAKDLQAEIRCDPGVLGTT